VPPPPAKPSLTAPGAACSPRSDDTAAVARPARRPLGAIVRVRGAPASPPERALGEGSCVLGAGENAHIIVDDPAVSRAHVELTLVPEGVAVRDLQSRNGTYYLGQRVESMVVTLGSRLRIGGAEIVVEPDLDALQNAPDAGGAGYRAMLGVSPAARRLFAILARLEGSLVSVLIQGESGSGKELVARALHQGSSISGGPLVAVNCGALPRELSLSELFGHTRGAFTGAVEARRGAFQAAHGGTLFLDEVGELPLDVQPVLLRALESGEVKVIGENEPRRVRVRVVSATNRDLQREVHAGRFREDLYYRLAVVKLEVAPLRERLEDMDILAQRFAAEAGLGALPPDVIQRLKRHSFPGNVRELRNVVEAYVALGALPDEAGPAVGGSGDASLQAVRGDADALDAALRGSIDPAGSYQEQKEALVSRFTRLYLEMLLARTGGNQSEAARVSGVERSYLGKLLAKHGVGKT
jgi:DNA-binding NtrC family response regulator